MAPRRRGGRHQGEGFRAKIRDQTHSEFPSHAGELWPVTSKDRLWADFMFFDRWTFRPLRLPYIIGKRTQRFYIVGGTHDIPEPIPVGYSLSTVGFGNHNRIFLVAEIRLFRQRAHARLSRCCRRYLSRGNVAAALRKLDGEKITISPPSSTCNSPPRSHWLPGGLASAPCGLTTYGAFTCAEFNIFATH